MVNMPRKILLVDDEEYIRALLEQTLEELDDVELLKASNGIEALAIIKAEKPGLIFLDVMMPEMNGYDVCRTVKHELKPGDIYIIMLTAQGQEFDKSTHPELGADFYISKPFDPDDLLNHARKVLSGDKQA